MQGRSAADQDLAEADRAFRAGRLDDARSSAERACGAAPHNLPAWLLCADVARAQGDLAALALALERAEDLAADRVLAANLKLDRAWALYGAGRVGDAGRLAGEIASPPLPQARLGIHAALLDALGRSQEVKVLTGQALRTSPDDPALLYQSALAQRALGNVDGAVEACDRAIAAAPGFIQAHALLSGARRWTPADHHVDRLRNLAARAREPLDRARLGYALFKELDDLDDRPAAWAALQAAGAEAKRVFPWSATRNRQALQLVETLASQAATSPTDCAPDAPRVLFIVGLPRSGTTLVDRVLGGHSRVQSLGELNVFPQLADRGAPPRPALFADLQTVERMRGNDWAEVGRAYRRQTELLSGGAPLVTDKNPQNWVYAPLIQMALPDAVIVHVVRDPMDSLFGAYKQLFMREHAWSYDLDDLAQHYRLYREAMERWRDRLGSACVEVAYETLAREPETTIPPLLEACGLAFEAQCLRPEAIGGAVRTLSSLQVREPINSRSIGGWRRYEAPLEPLRDRLAALNLLAPS